jgi:hypothetical protein
MYNLEATIEKIESQVTDDESRQALLRALKARLAELQQTDPGAGLTRLTNEIFGESGESGESALQPQALPSESEVSPGESAPLPSESGESTATSENAKAFAAALDKLDPALREAASDLYEHLHYKSKFARLTSIEREAIIQLLRYRTCGEIAAIIAQPPPIGLNLQTSKAGVIRFREDYLECIKQDRKLKALAEADAQRIANEEAFAKVNATDHTFRRTTVRQIRKRLFNAVQDPQADYHEIRWLIKSLEMLGDTQQTAGSPA